MCFYKVVYVLITTLYGLASRVALIGPPQLGLSRQQILLFRAAQLKCGRDFTENSPGGNFPIFPSTLQLRSSVAMFYHIYPARETSRILAYQVIFPGLSTVKSPHDPCVS